MKLNKNEVELFFKLHKSLLFYVNTKKGLIKNIRSVAELKGPVVEKAVLLRNFVTKEPGLIDSFVKENPFNFSSDELRIVEGWKRGVNDTFFIVKYDKGYTLFYGSKTKRCYGVLYLNDSFEDMLGPYLSIAAETWLIPFCGRIIYDGIMAPYSVSFGSGMQKSIKAEWGEAVVKYGVVTSFETQLKNSASDEELLRFYLKSEPNRDRYWEEMESLRKKSPELEAIYHQEQGRHHSREIRKRLAEVGAEGFFAVIDGTVVASSETSDELDKAVNKVISKEKLGWIFRFRIEKRQS